jgi:hypothetical protein
MRKTTKNAEHVKPVTGSCRWVKKPVLPCGLGRLAITSLTASGPVTAEYDIGCHLDHQGKVVGYRLVKDDDEAHDIDTSGQDWLCSCADAVYRERACKHVRALQVALPRCSVLI